MGVFGDFVERNVLPRYNDTGKTIYHAYGKPGVYVVSNVEANPDSWHLMINGRVIETYRPKKV